MAQSRGTSGHALESPWQVELPNIGDHYEYSSASSITRVNLIEVKASLLHCRQTCAILDFLLNTKRYSRLEQKFLRSSTPNESLFIVMHIAVAIGLPRAQRSELDFTQLQKRLKSDSTDSQLDSWALTSAQQTYQNIKKSDSDIRASDVLRYLELVSQSPRHDSVLTAIGWMFVAHHWRRAAIEAATTSHMIRLNLVEVTTAINEAAACYTLEGQCLGPEYDFFLSWAIFYFQL